jgi:KDO2-lipid IV(A) lauroyltransferase
MKYIAHLLSNLFLRLLAVMPWFVLHGMADLLFLLLYHIIRYRRKICWKNLTRSFPEKSSSELRAIRRRFYRHLSDLIVETAASLYFSKRRLQKMFGFSNPELMNELYAQGNHVIFITGHYNNWEWAIPLSYTFDYRVLAVYKPIRNRHFEETFRKIRGRYGAELVPMKRTGRTLFELDREGVLTLTGMVADQRPVKQQIQYWTSFLNQDTPVFLGSEKLAKKFNAAVVFMKVRKVRRSRYLADIELITTNPSSMAEHEITERHVRILEELIREDPAYWLWTHDRWKYNRADIG